MISSFSVKNRKIEIISEVYTCACGRGIGRSLKKKEEGMKLVPWNGREDLLGKDNRTPDTLLKVQSAIKDKINQPTAIISCHITSKVKKV